VTYINSSQCLLVHPDNYRFGNRAPLWLDKSNSVHSQDRVLPMALYKVFGVD